MVIEDRPRKSSGAAKFFGFIFVLALIGAAFYAGARYRDRVPFIPGLANVTNTQPISASQTPAPEDPIAKFERARRDVDRDPRNWINTEIPKELVSSGVPSALESPNPAFLYLYGRASLLTGNADEAMKAFEGAITKASLDPADGSETVKKEAALGFAAASLKTQKEREKALLHFDEAIKAPAPATSP